METASNFLFHRDARLAVYHGDACEVLPLLALGEMFCFTAPPEGIRCIEILRQCRGAVVYTANEIIFRQYWQTGWRHLIAEHRSSLFFSEQGSRIFTNMLATCPDGLDVWFDCSISIMAADSEPGYHLAARAIREMCHSPTVIDPFAGQGSTIKAALDLGLNAIAIDNRIECCAQIVENYRLTPTL